MSERIDRSPARFTSTLSVLAATVATVLVGLGGTFGLLAGILGLLALTGGVVRGSRRAVTLGGVALFVGVLAAGVGNAGPEPLLFGTAAAVLAWDFGEHAITVGEQLGRAAPTERGELAHAAASTFVATSAIAAGYLVYGAATGGQPMAALVLLLVAAVALVSALRN